MVPAAPGTLAFVKINSMGASMSEISQQYIILWIQCAIYFVLACRAYRYNIKKAKCERQYFYVIRFADSPFFIRSVWSWSEEPESC